MQILRCAKNSEPVSSNLAFGLYLIMEVEIFSLFLIRENSTLYRNMFNFIDFKVNVQLMVMFIFVLNLIQIIYLIGLAIWVRCKKKQNNVNIPKSKLLRFLQFKPYLFFAVFTDINVNGLITGDDMIKIISVFNIIVMVLELLVIRIINVSYRFIQKNYIRRKSSSIIKWVLVLVIIFTINIYDSLLYGGVILMIRALFVAFSNFHSLQNEQIRKSQWLYPLVSLQLGFLIIIKQYFAIQFFSNIIVFTFIILLTVYTSNSLAQHLSLQILKYHINNSEFAMNVQHQNLSQKSKQMIQINQNQLNNLSLQLRIIVKIYQMRLNKNTSQFNPQHKSQHYDYWWMIFNRFVLQHKVYCNNVQCQCYLLKPRQKTNYIIENTIMSNIITDLIQTIQFQSINCNKSKIIENYFLNQMLKKPLKSYFQIMKIEKDQLNREETLEVENLIHETRDNFKQLFLRQKVQNTDLDIEPLFQFQDHLKDMRLRLNEMAVEYRQFYEIFANNFVQMQTLKQKTRLLTEFKRQFSEEIELCLGQFDKSLELMTFCMVYFRFFDEYTNRLEKVEERAQYLVESFKNPVSEIKRGSVDIFDPHYGAVKADLVFNPGKIIKITKNMCYLLDYSYHQLHNQTINKMMPLMFSRNHDKFIRNFVEKGQIKIMQLRQKVVYARNNKKFIVPINLRLKVDYSSSEGMYTIAFTRLSETKSEFILMNNYGKVEEITAGIFTKIFGRALREENRKVKRLCVGKFLLSFNNVLKNIEKTNGLVYEGLLLSSNSQEVLMDYYKFPQFGKIYKGKSQNGQSSNRSYRSGSSVQQSFSGTDASRTIDLSDDITKYSIDLKEALRVYLKNFDYRKVTGFRVTYRCQDFITSEFKCKVLQIINVSEQLTGKNLGETIKQEIIDLGQVIGLQEQQIQDFKIFKQSNSFISKSFHSMNSQFKESQQNISQLTDNLVDRQKQTKLDLRLVEDRSQTGSVLSLNEKIRKKQSLVNAFKQKTIVNSTLQLALTILILVLAFILIIICIFSVQLQSNYQDIQEDNLVLTNYRIDFLLLFGIQQLGLMYKSYNLTAPKFLQEKKSMFAQRMKQQLVKSTTWIDISQEGYKVIMPYKYQDIDFQQRKSILANMIQYYTTFLADEQRGHYITDNYVTISAYLLGLTSLEEVLITNSSKNYRSQIHIVIACYSFVLVVAIGAGIWYRRLALKKQDKIIDFLPFLQPKDAKRNEIFFEKFYQMNKQSQQIDLDAIQTLYDNIGLQRLGKKSEKNFTKQLVTAITDIHKKQTQLENTARILIRVVKNQNNGVTLKIVAFSLFVLLLCLFVIFYSQFFFASADSKFWTYLQLKNSAFLIQLIPSRIIVLYFSNINKMLKNQTLYNYPESFYRITHDRIFQLQFGLSNAQFYGTEMEEIISDHFNRQICSMIECSEDPTQMNLVKNQQVFYLAYRFSNSFSYMRKIIKKLPNMTNPRQEVKNWIMQNDILELLETTQFILDLMKRSEKIITDLFTQQINLIGNVLLGLSLTLIPTLIMVLLFFKRKYVQYVVQKLKCTQNIFMNLSWNMLSQNNYAVNYFEGKIKNAKKN